MNPQDPLINLAKTIVLRNGKEDESGSGHPSKDFKWSSEIHASRILNALPDAVFATDQQTRITFFNQAASVITGFRPNEAYGMYCKDVLKSGICDTNCPVKRALESKRNIFNVETTVHSAGGKTSDILISAALIVSDQGEVLGYLHIFRDITAVKEIMTQLSQRNIELDRTINELKKTQAQLIHAQKMESMGLLAGGIAHDFNNLLSGILGYASLLKVKMDKGSPLFSYVDIIESSALKASKLTKQLLNFSKGGKCHLEVVEVNKVIEETLNILERTIGKKINIQKRLYPGLGNIEADRSQLEQVLMNLCINACDAMPHGGKLTIVTENVYMKGQCPGPFLKAGPGEYVKISISDTGEGIDPEIQGRIFDPFFTTKGDQKGTGLGLSVVYGIVRDHGGSIDVQSTPGLGTTFDIYLPRCSGALEKGENQSGPWLTAGQETILVVDDEKTIRDLVNEALSTSGYKVLTASDGQEAVRIVRDQGEQIDLVLLDLVMPKMEGIETLRLLRKINPSIKVLVSSGFSRESTDQKIFELGAVDFMQKPYKIEELNQKVRRALDRA